MSFDIAALFAERGGERYDLHTRYLNEQMVRMLKAIGFDRRYVRGSGQYLYDDAGTRYLDLLSGWGVFAIGRNHPALRDALTQVLDGDYPNLVQMDVSAFAGVLAEKLLARAPYLDKAFFANSGAESVEAAIKFARGATGRTGIVHCDHAFHGLTYGALSVNGDDVFRRGFEPLLPDCVEIPFDDLGALEKALHGGNVAAFIVEPIQGKGVTVPSDGYLRGALELCRRHGTLLIADEIQVGMGRTGRFLACEHWGVEPDMVLLAKALSGGHVPVGAVLMRKWIFNKIFDRMDRAVVHGSTFSKNDLAMVAALATLDVIENEKADRECRKARRPAARRVPANDAASRTRQGRARQRHDHRHRVRVAAVAEIKGLLEPAGISEQGLVRPAHRDSLDEGAQDHRAGRRSRHHDDQALAIIDDYGRRLRLDRKCVRKRYCRCPSRSGRRLVAWKNFD